MELKKFCLVVLIFTLSCKSDVQPKIESTSNNWELSRSGFFNQGVDKTPLKKHYRSYESKSPVKYIVFHTTGDYSSKVSGDNYEANRQFFRNYADTVSRVASWHFTVDETGVSQLCSVNKRCYHASNKQFNSQSIGIEVCVNKYKNAKDFEQVINNVKKLTDNLFRLFPEAQLIRHQDADLKNHKNCPEIFTDSQWKVLNNFLLAEKPLPADFFNNYTKLAVEYRSGKYQRN